MPNSAPPTVTISSGNSTVNVSLVHMIEYYTKGIDERGPHYDVQYYIDTYSEADAVVNALLGIGRSQPHRYPLSPNLICVSAVADGLGKQLTTTDGTPSYAFGAKIRAQYRSAMWNGLTQTADDPSGVQSLDPSNPILWCTQTIEYETETFTSSRGKYHYQSDNAVIDSPVQFDIHMQVMTLKYHKFPYLPASLMRGYQGRINSSAILGCGAKTLLCRGARTERQWDSSGECVQSADLVIVYRDQDWNKVYRDDSGIWDYALSPANFYRYTAVDFSTLFSALAPP